MARFHTLKALVAGSITLRYVFATLSTTKTNVRFFVTETASGDEYMSPWYQSEFKQSLPSLLEASQNEDSQVVPSMDSVESTKGQSALDGPDPILTCRQLPAMEQPHTLSGVEFYQEVPTSITTVALFTSKDAGALCSRLPDALVVQHAQKPGLQQAFIPKTKHDMITTEEMPLKYWSFLSYEQTRVVNAAIEAKYGISVSNRIILSKLRFTLEDAHKYDEYLKYNDSNDDENNGSDPTLEF